MKTLKKIRSTSVGAADICIYDNGIMHINIKIRNSFTINDSHEIVAARTSLAKGKKYPVMYTTKYSFVTPSNEVSEYLTSPERTRLVLADAFVVKSFSQRLAAKAYYLIKKPKKPTSIFSSEEKALEWLEAFA